MSALALEDFGDLKPKSAPEPGDASPAAEPAPSYDDGYKAGWEDATQSAVSERDRVHAEFARAIEDVRVSFEEAKSQVRRSLHPLLDALVSAVLPALSRDTAGPRLIEIFEREIDGVFTAPLELEASAEDAEFLQEQLAARPDPTIMVRIEPSLISGQMRFGLGAEEHEIDCDRLLQDLREALGFNLNAEDNARRHA